MHKNKSLVIIFALILMLFTIKPMPTFSQEIVSLIRPVEGRMVFEKKPEIEFHIPIPYDPDSLYVELDYTDMTTLIKITPAGFVIRPVQVLAPGDHSLFVSFKGQNNQVVSKEYRFSTRHTRSIEQADSQNNISVIYNNVLKKTDNAKNRQMPSWSLVSNINSRNILSEGPWELGFATNLRYLDQQLEVYPPEDKGLEVIDYQFTGKYEKGSASLLAALGDVSIDITQNTVRGLARRGGKIDAATGSLYASGFVVRSDPVYGLEKETGLEFDDADHIFGGTFGLKLLDDRIDLKTIYARGGESGSGSIYGVWPDPAGTRGDVLGFEIKTDFFDRKLETRFEWDQSDFDTDTGDNLGARSDKAYSAGIKGVINILDYEVAYDYTGPDYQVPGNPSIFSDRKGVSTRAGLTFDSQSFSGYYGRYKSNVDNDPALSTVTSSIFGVDYNLALNELISLKLSFNRSIEDSSNEPAFAYETKTYSDLYSGSIDYQKGALTLGIAPAYSKINDRTTADYDTSSKALTLYGSYANDRFTLMPSFTRDRFTDHFSNIKTDTLSGELYFLIHIAEGLKFEGTLGYIKQDNSDNSLDQEDYNADIQLEYSFTSPVKGFLTPAVILKAAYQDNNDKILISEDKETILYLFITADLDFSF